MRCRTTAGSLKPSRARPPTRLFGGADNNCLELVYINSVEGHEAVLALFKGALEGRVRAPRPKHIVVLHHPLVDTLIIEDYDAMARDLKDIVTRLGHRVVGIAKTAQQGVALAKDLKPGLIVSGVNLGQALSGIDAIKEIRRELEVPVVFVTAMYEKALASGEADPACVVEKPYTFKAIEAAVRSAIAQRRA